MYFLAIDATQWILPVVLLVLLVGIFVLNYFKNKKNQETMKNMVDNLKVGDNVKTYSGLYGKIIEIVETTDGKVAVLETGSEKNKGIFSIDINAIYGIDEKKPVVYDANGNVVDENTEKVEENSEVKVEEKPVETKEEIATEEPVKKEKTEEVVEEKPVEEKPAKEKAKSKKSKKENK